MRKKFFAVSGMFVFVGCLLLLTQINKADKTAQALDGKKTGFGIVEGPPPCTWEVQPPERVVSENRTQALVIQTSNASDEVCETILTLRAPGFDLSPNKEEQKISLQATSSGSISWIMTPRKTGTYEIAVTDMINTRIFGISVNTMFGLSAVQAKIFSVLGSIFGPMLTIPWWGEKLWHWRKRKSE